MTGLEPGAVVSADSRTALDGGVAGFSCGIALRQHLATAAVALSVAAVGALSADFAFAAAASAGLAAVIIAAPGATIVAGVAGLAEGAALAGELTIGPVT